jgi:hypothetical protein
VVALRRLLASEGPLRRELASMGFEPTSGGAQAR